MQLRFIRKLLVCALLGAVVPTALYAAPSTVAKRNDNAATTFQGTNNQDAPISVDDKGRFFLAPTPIKVTTDGTPIPVSITTPVGVNFLGTPQPVNFAGTPQPINFAGTPQPVNINTALQTPIPVTFTTPVGVTFLSTPQPVNFAGTPQPVNINVALQTPIPVTGNVTVINGPLTPVPITHSGTPQPVNFAGTPQPVNVNVALQTPIPVVFTTPVGVNFLGTPQPVTFAGTPQPVNVNVALQTPIPVVFTTPVGVTFLGTPQPITHAGTPQPVTFAGTPQPVNFLGTPQPVTITEANQPFSAPKVNSALTPIEHIALMLATQPIINDTAETGSTSSTINATAHAARPGDIIEFTTGVAANIGVINWVDTIATNSFTLKFTLPGTPANGNAFNIRRQKDVTVTGNASNLGHALYTAIDSVYGGVGATALLKQSGGIWGVSDSAVPALFKSFENGHGGIYTSDSDGGPQYSRGNVDPSGRIAVTIDGQFSGMDSACAEDGGAVTWTTILAGSLCESSALHVRNISCTTTDTDITTGIRFSFINNGSGNRVLWVGGVSGLSKNGPPWYTSGPIIPALHGFIDEDFQFYVDQESGSNLITCCANYYCDIHVD